MQTHYAYTLLFVDDEVGILNGLRRVFRREDYRLLLATSGQEALEVLRENDVSVIVSDQRMPGMSGAQLMAQSIHIAPHAVRILLTGYSDIDDAVRSINEGQIFRYLSKPWDDMELKHCILQALVFHDLSRQREGIIDDLKRTIAQLKKENANLLAERAPTSAHTGDHLAALRAENEQLRSLISQRDALLHSWKKQLDDALSQLRTPQQTHYSQKP